MTVMDETDDMAGNAAFIDNPEEDEIAQIMVPDLTN